MRVGVSLPVAELRDDLVAIRDFAQTAEGLGLTHLRVPDRVLQPGGKHLHEPMLLLAYIAAITSKIELVPAVVVLPSRQTVLFAKQATELDVLSGGRLRLGIGVGGNEAEYAFQRVDFRHRGARCSEQMKLLKALWTLPKVDFEGRFDRVIGAGLDPMPVQKPIPLWIGTGAQPADSVISRIGQLSDGWFVLSGPQEFSYHRDRVSAVAQAASRDPAQIGTEAEVDVVGKPGYDWSERVVDWGNRGLTHLCLCTLRGGLGASAHLDKLREAVKQIPL